MTQQGPGHGPQNKADSDDDGIQNHHVLEQCGVKQIQSEITGRHGAEGTIRHRMGAVDDADRPVATEVAEVVEVEQVASLAQLGLVEVD